MTSSKCKHLLAMAGALLAALLLDATASATIPYTPVPITGAGIGPGIMPPAEVWGKEYSHDRDHEITAVGVAIDPQQIVAWDGIGGVANGLDYTGTRPNFTPDIDIDAIANRGDALYFPLKSDQSHLIYSISRNATSKSPPPPPTATAPYLVPSAGPIGLVNGNVIGGAAEISFELGVVPGPLPNTHGLWAAQAAINGDPLPEDIDGIEVWGPEPAYTADANKYSLFSDSLSGISVWNGAGTPYIPHATIMGAVTSLLGPATNLPLIELVDLDALMVRDSYGNPDVFERDPAGGTGSDEIIFSIRQILNPGDPSGYYATGSELMVINAAGVASFLRHGGHFWDKAYALTDMVALLPGATGGNVFVQLDIDAIESVADRGDQIVPEPASGLLCLLAFAMTARCRCRRQ